MSKKGKTDYQVDIMDVNWVVDHVQDIKARIDVLKKLGYKIGYNVVVKGKETVTKTIIKGKRDEIRIQVSSKIPNLPLCYCAIIGDNNE